MSKSSIRLGVASPATQETTAETLAELYDFARRAAVQNVDILLLPEAYIGGYPRGSAFGATIGNRSAEGREEFLHYWQHAIDLGDTVGDGAGAGTKWVNRELPPDPHASPINKVSGRNGAGGEVGSNDDEGRAIPSRGDGSREEIEKIARGSGVFLVVGCIEKAGGSLYCSVLYVCPKLGVIGKRRKVMPVSPFHPFYLPLQTHSCHWDPHTTYLSSNNSTHLFFLASAVDRNRTPHLGTGITSYTKSRQHRDQRSPGQPCRRHLLGELHASPPADPL
jgi:hypothetical protein